MQAAWAEQWDLALPLKDTKLDSGGNKKMGRNLPAIRELTVLLYFSQVVLSSKKHLLSEEEGIHGAFLEDFGSGLKGQLGFRCTEYEEEHPGRGMALAVTSAGEAGCVVNSTLGKSL